jgi:transposase, IS30 family
MGRGGTSPDHDKREAFARLIAEGVPSARASRIVGINPRTGKRWRNGRRLASGGRVLDMAPVITTPPTKHYSPRYLSEDERVHLADLHREGRSMREAAMLMARSPSTISRKLGRGADDAGRFRPFGRTGGRSGAAACTAPAACPGTRCCATGSRAGSRPTGARSRSPAGSAMSSRASRDAGCAPRRSTRRCTAPTSVACPRELPGRVLRLRRRRRRLRRRDAQARRTGPVAGMTPIGERPAEALGREQPGHWEGDLIVGAGHVSAIVTLVERTTRYTLLGHLPGATRRRCATLSWRPSPACRPACGGRSRGTREPRWPGPPRSPPPWRWRACTSATRTHPGSAPPTRTPTACCAPTSPRAPTCPSTPPTRSLSSSSS